MPFIWKCAVEAVFAAVLEPVCGSRRSHFSLTDHEPSTCFCLNLGLRTCARVRSHTRMHADQKKTPWVSRLKESEGCVCQAYPFW